MWLKITLILIPGELFYKWKVENAKELHEQICTVTTQQSTARTWIGHKPLLLLTQSHAAELEYIISLNQNGYLLAMGCEKKLKTWSNNVSQFPMLRMAWCLRNSNMEKMFGLREFHTKDYKGKIAIFN